MHKFRVRLKTTTTTFIQQRHV